MYSEERFEGWPCIGVFSRNRFDHKAIVMNPNIIVLGICHSQKFVYKYNICKDTNNVISVYHYEYYNVYTSGTCNGT